MFKMRAQLKNQSSFVASMGAVMGSLMWKTSKMSSVVETLLSSNRVSELLCIVSGSLESFMETYGAALPDTSTNEMQFILALVGVVSNMAATPAGRQFLVTDPNGRETVHQMADALPRLPDPSSGQCLRRLLLMNLYNISINQMGLLMLLEKKSLFEEIAKCMMLDSNPEQRVLSLRLLQSLTLNVSSDQLYRHISLTIPMNKLDELTNTTDAEMRLLAKSIMGNLSRCRDKLADKAPAQASSQPRCRRPSATPAARSSSCSLLSSL